MNEIESAELRETIRALHGFLGCGILVVARGFCAVIVGSMAIGLALVGFGVDPIRALYLSAIFTGLTAPPLILLKIILARSRAVLGEFRSGRVSLVATSIAGIAMTILALLKS